MDVAGCKLRLQSATFLPKNESTGEILTMNTLDYFIFTIDILLMIGFGILLYPEFKTLRWYRKKLREYQTSD